jgi:NMD protein affecting ribosome stability and mRNA decay
MSEEHRVTDPSPCDECGQPVTLAWTAPRALWRHVMGPTERGILCPACFVARAGISLLWVPFDGRCENCGEIAPGEPRLTPAPPESGS